MSFLKHEEIIKRCEKINQSYEIDPEFFDRIVDDLLDSEQDTEAVILKGFKRLLAEVDNEIDGRIHIYEIELWGVPFVVTSRLSLRRWKRR